MRCARRAVHRVPVLLKVYGYSKNEKRLQGASPKTLNSLIDADAIKMEDVDREVVNYLIDEYLDHRFDLLGSGWTQVAYNINARGLEGVRFPMNRSAIIHDQAGDWLKSMVAPAHYEMSAKLWRLVSSDYTAIDWQLDFKSGFRWDAKESAWNQRKSTKTGADIKVPWELARMQHLPRMAVFAVEMPERRKEIIREFKDEVLDFVSANPPGMGVNWTCTMDVAIRAANLLFAYDLLKQIDEAGDFDSQFEAALIDSIRLHGSHIVSNLEWNRSGSKNHYLANIVGLLWVAAYLPASELFDAWLVFSVQEIIDEVDHQFNPDGSNFESSTAYHCLCGEMVLYSTALILGIMKTERKSAFVGYNHQLVPRLRPAGAQKYSMDNADFFPEDYLERLQNMAEFTADITKPDGKIVQFGDNDSGRLLKISPLGSFIDPQSLSEVYLHLRDYIPTKKHYWDEDDLNKESLLSAFSALIPKIKKGNESCLAGLEPVESRIVKSLSQGSTIGAVPGKLESKAEAKATGDDSMRSAAYSEITVVHYKDHGLQPIDDAQQRSYLDFGMHLFSARDLSLYIQTGSRSDACGHAHNDRGSFQLVIKGKDIFTDRGAYLYTPLPDRRDEFRSVCSHNVPIVDGMEQNAFLSPFSMEKKSTCRLIDVSDCELTLEIENEAFWHRRIFKIMSDRLEIHDASNRKFVVNTVRPESHAISNGYGKLQTVRNEGVQPELQSAVLANN